MTAQPLCHQKHIEPAAYRHDDGGELSFQQQDRAKRHSEVAQLNPPDPTMNKMIGNFLDSGGRILACPPCELVSGYSRESLIDGAAHDPRTQYEVLPGAPANLRAALPKASRGGTCRKITTIRRPRRAPSVDRDGTE